MKRLFRKGWKRAKLYLSLPHFWVVGIVQLLSITLQDNNPFLSSIFANIFAGLITGLVISFISAIKAASLYRTESLIKWLTFLHEDILEFFRRYHKLISFNKYEELKDEKTLYEYIYDTLCYGEGINETIRNGRYKESFPFNLYEYFKKGLEHDAENHSKENNMLRERIMVLDVSNITSKELRSLFQNMERQLFMLNGNILKHLTNLEARKKVINVALM